MGPCADIQTSGFAWPALRETTIHQTSGSHPSHVFPDVLRQGSEEIVDIAMLNTRGRFDRYRNLLQPVQ